MIERDIKGRFIKGHIPLEEWKECWSILNKQHRHTDETKNKISKSTKGINNHFYGKKHSKSTKLKMSIAHKKHILTPEHKFNLSISLKKAYSNPELLKRILRRRNISNLELKFKEIINKLNLPYKFVGNGDFIIGRKCPDFINTNGEKIAIEVYYRRHKELFRNGLEKWKLERQELFNKYGWRIVFFNETEVNEKNILCKLTLGGG